MTARFLGLLFDNKWKGRSPTPLGHSSSSLHCLLPGPAPAAGRLALSSHFLVSARGTARTFPSPLPASPHPARHLQVPAPSSGAAVETEAQSDHSRSSRLSCLPATRFQSSGGGPTFSPTGSPFLRKSSKAIRSAQRSLFQDSVPGSASAVPSTLGSLLFCDFRTLFGGSAGTLSLFSLSMQGAQHYGQDGRDFLILEKCQQGKAPRPHLPSSLCP